MQSLRKQKLTGGRVRQCAEAKLAGELLVVLDELFGPRLELSLMVRPGLVVGNKNFGDQRQVEQG